MYQSSKFETPQTFAIIRDAPLECFELLRQYNEYELRLAGPRVVATSAGVRLVREVALTESLWRIWSQHYWKLTKLGLVVSKDDGKWTARLWTRLAPNTRPIIKLSHPVKLEGGRLLYRLILLGS
jgi:hypothetical protein